MRRYPLQKKYTYIVTQGQYDSYRICAVFSKLYHARSYVMAYAGTDYMSEMTIEKHITDHKVDDTAKGIVQHIVKVSKGGYAIDAYKWEFDSGLKTPRHKMYVGGETKGGANVYVSAKNEKEAKRKAVEYFKKLVKP